MASTVEQAIVRHAEFLQAHHLILQQLLAELAATDGKLLSRLSEKIAKRIADHEPISSGLAKISDANALRRVDELLSGARRRSKARRGGL